MTAAMSYDKTWTDDSSDSYMLVEMFREYQSSKFTSVQ